jgi:hypothetical protein
MIDQLAGTKDSHRAQQNRTDTGRMSASHRLASAAQHAAALRLITENTGVANWGGHYSIIQTRIPPDHLAKPARR